MTMLTFYPLTVTFNVVIPSFFSPLDKKMQLALFQMGTLHNTSPCELFVTIEIIMYLNVHINILGIRSN